MGSVYTLRQGNPRCRDAEDLLKVTWPFSAVSFLSHKDFSKQLHTEPKVLPRKKLLILPGKRPLKASWTAKLLRSSRDTWCTPVAFQHAEHWGIFQLLNLDSASPSLGVWPTVSKHRSCRMSLPLNTCPCLVSGGGWQRAQGAAGMPVDWPSQGGVG